MSEVTIDSDEDEVKPVRLEVATRSVRALDIVQRAQVSIRDTSWELDLGDGDLARVDTPTLQHFDELQDEVLRQTRLQLHFEDRARLARQVRELVNDYPVTEVEPQIALVTPYEDTYEGRKSHDAGVYVLYGIRVPRYSKLIWKVFFEEAGVSQGLWTTSDKLLKPAKLGHAALIQDHKVIRVNVSRSMWRQAMSWAVEDADDDTPGIDLVREDWRQAISGLSSGSNWVKRNGKWERS